MSDRSNYVVGTPADFRFDEGPSEAVLRQTIEHSNGDLTDEPTTCDESVGPKTYREAIERSLDRPPFEFTPEDFEWVVVADIEDERRVAVETSSVRPNGIDEMSPALVIDAEGRRSVVPMSARSSLMLTSHTGSSSETSTTPRPRNFSDRSRLSPPLRDGGFFRARTSLGIMRNPPKATLRTIRGTLAPQCPRTFLGCRARSPGRTLDDREVHEVLEYIDYLQHRR